MNFRIVNPASLGEPRGWNNGLLASAGGRLLFVAGQSAAGPDGGIPGGARGDFVEQFALALDKALAVVREAGGAPEHVGRVTIFVTDLDAYLACRQPLGAAWRARMGKHFPAVALYEVKRLVDEGAIVEIEVTAVLP